MQNKDMKKQLIEQYKTRKITGGVYAIKNKVNGKIFLVAETDINGSRNRFEFSQKTGSCVSSKLQRDWSECGAQAFEFQVLEELEMKDTQSAKEFREDLAILLEMWREKYPEELLY